MCGRSAREHLLTGPGRRRISFCRSRDQRTLAAAPERRAHLRGGFSIPRRRVPGTRAAGLFFGCSRFLGASGKTIADVINSRPRSYTRLWQPVLLAALNTDPKEASARLAAAIVRETFLAGRPRLPSADRTRGLEHSLRRSGAGLFASARWNDPFRTPAARIVVRRRARRGARFRRRQRETWVGRRRHSRRPAAGCRFDAARSEKTHGIPRHRQRAFPRRAAGRLSADHGRHQRPGGMAVRLPRPAVRDHQRRGSAARNAPRDAGRGHLARCCEQSQALRMPCPHGRSCANEEPLSPHCRRKTTSVRRRKRSGDNLALAGDWTATGLPATIEGAVRSGNKAADIVSRN